MPYPRSLIIQQPLSATQLLLLFHGVGSTAEAMVPLGRRLAVIYPEAYVLSLDAPKAADGGRGHQWFSLRRINDERRRVRADAALPGFLAAIANWQRVAGIGPDHTTLIGFSQGAVMVLQSAQQAPQPASRFVAIAGRLAGPPRAPLAPTAIHLVHGLDDRTISPQQTTLAGERLSAAGANVTVDILPGLGHQLSEQVIALLIDRLKGTAAKPRTSGG